MNDCIILSNEFSWENISFSQIRSGFRSRCTGLRVKSTWRLSEFDQRLVIIPIIVLHENQLSGSRVVPADGNRHLHRRFAATQTHVKIGMYKRRVARK